jgi:hypothetical protein
MLSRHSVEGLMVKVRLPSMLGIALEVIREVGRQF